MTRTATNPLRVINVFVLSVAAFVLSAADRSLTQNVPLFLPPVTYSSGGITPLSVAVVDLNQDGKLDLVVANYCGGTSACTGTAPGTVGVLLGNGDGTFQAPVTYNSGGFVAWRVVVADMNGDGKPDLIVTNVGGSGGVGLGHATVGVLLGNGDGTFQPAVVSDSGGFPGQSLAIGEMNRDGKLDVVVGHCDVSGFCFTGSGNVAVLLGNGDGSFQPASLYGSGGQDAESVSLADVNGDGKLDILVANCAPANGAGSCPGEGIVGVLFGRGDGTFEPAVTYNSGVYATRSSTVADVNGDGKPDLLVAAEECGFGICDNRGEGGISVLLGNGDGTFQLPVVYGSGGCGANSVAVSDLNGDGKTDVIVANEELVCGGGRGAVGVLLGNRDGTFQRALTYNVPGLATSAVAADVNGDGRPDLVVTNGNSVSVLLNNTPSCTTPPAVTVEATPTSLWPPNGKMALVTVSGTIRNNTGCKVTGATYAVADEYGRVQPSGPATVGAGGAYSFTVPLQASRLGSDLDGRLYTITVTATNNTGKSGSQTATVIVPHDQRH